VARDCTHRQGCADHIGHPSAKVKGHQEGIDVLKAKIMELEGEVVALRVLCLQTR
jgi:hypothetical protein